MSAPKGKYAWTVKIGERGQFVIPKEARELFGLHPGDTILVLGDEERGLAIPQKAVADQMIDRLLQEVSLLHEEAKDE